MAGDIRRRLRRLETQWGSARTEDLSQLSDEELERRAAHLTAKMEAELGINISRISNSQLLKIVAADVDDAEFVRLLRAASAENSEIQAAELA